MEDTDEHLSVLTNRETTNVLSNVYNIYPKEKILALGRERQAVEKGERKCDFKSFSNIFSSYLTCSLSCAFSSISVSVKRSEKLGWVSFANK